MMRLIENKKVSRSPRVNLLVGQNDQFKYAVCQVGLWEIVMGYLFFRSFLHSLDQTMN